MKEENIYESDDNENEAKMAIIIMKKRDNENRNKWRKMAHDENENNGGKSAWRNGVKNDHMKAYEIWQWKRNKWYEIYENGVRK